MPVSPLSDFIRYLRRVGGSADAETASDGQLLERFVRRRDESAFETLMARHGPMVLGICRRILGNPHDADDAFQAVFLILAHKAASIGRPQALASWLYRIAQRTAVRAKAERTRRRARESILDDPPAPEAVEELAWHELRPVLDEEVNRLPRKYRDAIVCCYRHKDGFEIIGVSLDKDAETVEKVCAKKGLTWPQVLVPTDDKTRDLWYEAAGLVSVPRLLVIDRKGVLRADCGPDQLEKEIAKVLDQ